jgi:LuxR family maltose regulon positive regulatory protein
LVQRLNQGFRLGHKLALISAPAGFGKTTLVSEWVAAMRADAGNGAQDVAGIAWLSLDESDDDPIRFLSYMVTALSQADGLDASIGKNALSVLRSPQPPSAVDVLASLINDIAAISGRLLLVLDDYHVVGGSSVDDALDYLLEHLPPQLLVLIATREDPPLVLARLRAQGLLTELRAADLRFSSAEGADFLKRVMGLDLSPDDIVALESRTEGWITGLQLAAISMQGSNDSSAFIKSFTGSHRYVLDYLIEEVLRQQPARTQEFLLQTAVLNRLTAPLCDALTGQNDGQDMLDTLDRANLFVVPLDEERRWYRYHHLFADLLRRRLSQKHPEVVSLLHVRAAAWFRDRGNNHEAIKHFLTGGDHQSAAELIEAVALKTIQQGDHTTVTDWINALQEDLVNARPFLCVLHARALQLAGELETSEARLIAAEHALDGQDEQDDEARGLILGLIHSCRAYSFFMVGDQPNTIFHAEQALDQLPSTASLIRVQTALYLGIAYRYQGQLQAAMDVYNDVLPITETESGLSIVVLGYLHLGDLHMEMAQLHRAKELYEHALRYTEQSTGRPDMPFTGYAYVSIGCILRQQNQLQEALRLTTKGIALCRDWNVADILGLSCLELAYVYLALEDNERADESLQEATELLTALSAWGGRIAAAAKARFDLARGDIESAAEWAQANDLVLNGTFEFYRETEYLVLARVFIAQQRFEEARAWAERILRVAQEIGRRQTELEGLILLALAAAAQGENDEALVCMQDAIAIGEPEGFIRVFVDEGRPMIGLLEEALDRGIKTAYVRRLLAAFTISGPAQPQPSQDPSPVAGLVEPLSEREIEVLQLVAEGLTNSEIASRLFLSPHTIKVHVRNIFGKLGVHNRTKAVVEARSLGLLPRD